MYQQITIVGNVGKAPELRYLQSGVAVCDFTVAVNKRITDASGQKRETVTWFKVTAWRQLAETVNQYVAKGQSVLVVGEIKASAYTAKDGTPTASLEISANEIRFLGGRDNADSPQNAPQAPRDEDLPF